MTDTNRGLRHGTTDLTVIRATTMGTLVLMVLIGNFLQLLLGAGEIGRASRT